MDSARGAIQSGLKILARYSQTGLGFSARPNGLKNPCNRYHFFSRAEKGARACVSIVLSHLSKLSHGNLFHYIKLISLHGDYQPGLKFRSAHRAEILLRLHAQFQPGRKTQISVRKFTEVRKHNRYACSRSFFIPG